MKYTVRRVTRIPTIMLPAPSGNGCGDRPESLEMDLAMEETELLSMPRKRARLPRRTMPLLPAVMAATLLFKAGMALGHHAFSAFYDTANVGDLRGELIEIHWVNPHTRFTLRTPDGDVWNVETAPVNRLQRLGLAGVVSVGDTVTFIGAFSRLGRNEFLTTHMALPAGGEVALDPGLAGRLGLGDRVSPGGADATVATADSSAASGEMGPGPQPEGIFRVWTRTESPQDRTPRRSFTETALAARDAWDPVTDDPALRCIAPGMPVVMDTPFPIAFEENDDGILLRIEQWDALRTIHLDSNTGADNPPGSHMGHSVGRWEDQTLVVETTAMSWPYVDEFGTPKSDGYTLVERFAFSEDGRGMTWEATATDPATYSEPAYLGRVSYSWVPGVEIKPYNCTIPLP